MNQKERWEKAQQYEKNWWGQSSGEIKFGFYKDFAESLLKFTEGQINITQKTQILEVGSGAGGIVTFLKESENRYAIDPLENFYSSVEDFTCQRDKTVNYFNAIGEEIPFEDSKFDLLIIDNVLDHCRDPLKVMQECKRVLSGGGLIYMKQNTYHIWGVFIRYLMEVLLIDKGHPHTFTKKNLKDLISRNGLKVIKEERKGYFSTWRKELTSGGMKNLIKAVLFVTRDKVTFLISKNN